MKNAIIVHGQPSKEEYYNPEMPSMSNAHWIPWLQGQLLKQDIVTATPDIPFAYKPDYKLWKREVERFDVTPETLLIGHSRGCDFWLKWLSENRDRKVGRVVLVAPGLGYLTELDNYFGYFDIDPDLAERTNGFSIFGSDNDAEEIIEAVSEIRNKVKNIKYTQFHLGHFTSRSMGTTNFPELLSELTA